MSANEKAARDGNRGTANKQHGKMHRQFMATSRAAQRQRIGAYLLEHGRASTIDLRDKCNAMHPAGRIKEMRALGWSIATVWRWSHDAHGRPHKCGLYILTRGGARHD